MWWPESMPSNHGKTVSTRHESWNRCTEQRHSNAITSLFELWAIIGSLIDNIRCESIASVYSHIHGCLIAPEIVQVCIIFWALYRRPSLSTRSLLCPDKYSHSQKKYEAVILQFRRVRIARGRPVITIGPHAALLEDEDNLYAVNSKFTCFTLCISCVSILYISDASLYWFRRCYLHAVTNSKVPNFLDDHYQVERVRRRFESTKYHYHLSAGAAQLQNHKASLDALEGHAWYLMTSIKGLDCAVAMSSAASCQYHSRRLCNPYVGFLLSWCAESLVSGCMTRIE